MNVVFALLASGVSTGGLASPEPAAPLRVEILHTWYQEGAFCVEYSVKKWPEGAIIWFMGEQTVYGDESVSETVTASPRYDTLQLAGLRYLPEFDDPPRGRLQPADVGGGSTHCHALPFNTTMVLAVRFRMIAAMFEDGSVVGERSRVEESQQQWEREGAAISDWVTRMKHASASEGDARPALAKLRDDARTWEYGEVEGRTREEVTVLNTRARVAQCVALLFDEASQSIDVLRLDPQVVLSDAIRRVQLLAGRMREIARLRLFAQAAPR